MDMDEHIMEAEAEQLLPVMQEEQMEVEQLILQKQQIEMNFIIM
jgi:hypothetical protein